MTMWKPVKDYEGLYEVSSSGEVRSKDREIATAIRHNQSRIARGRLLKQNRKRNGYMTVDLAKNGKVKTTLVHRIVAEAFLPPVPGCEYVNHKDGVKTNNSASNLEWVTSSRNRQHAIEHKLARFTQSRQIRCIENGIVFPHSLYAARWVDQNYPGAINGSEKVAARNIRDCANGRAKSAYGFTWEFTEGSTTIPKGSTRKRVEMGGPSNEGEDIV